MQNHNEFLDDLENEARFQPDSLLNDQNSDLSLKNRNEDEIVDDWFQILEDLWGDQLPQDKQRDTQISSNLANSWKDFMVQMREEDMKAVEELWMDSKRFFDNIKEWIETAMVQWSKWEILPDRHARGTLLQLYAKITWRTKPNPVINVMNMFGKIDTDNEKNIY